MSYPRIWDRNTERKIIGETAISWLVEQTWTHKPEKVNKKKPNGTFHPQWFFDERERDLEVWADRHFSSIKRTMGEYSRNIDSSTLLRVAELIGYVPLLEQDGRMPDAAGETSLLQRKEGSIE